MTDPMDLPPPPIDAEVDLTSFAYMPLEVARLRRSKAWLICKRRPELAFYMMNLWTASWHERPPGSLEDDDDVLADFAMCPPKEWSRIRADVMRGWLKCSDGRLYHKVVVEKANEAWLSKLTHAYDKECGRLRKEAQRKKVKDFVPPTFTEWNAARLATAKNGTSNGRPNLSQGRPKDIRETSHGSPEEIALKGREGKGKGEVRDTYMGCPQDRRGTECPEDSGNERQLREPLTLEEAQQLQSTYPVGTYRQSEWLVVEKLVNWHLEAGVTFERILGSFERYAAQCRAREIIGTQYVLSPVKHCDRDRPLFDEPFPIPRTKAEAQQDANVDAARVWLAEQETGT
ncbi:MAG: hypothetical protein JWO52_2556 [Gammaproteobacteria bacterium]|nr:hypothetical protein [Gammaproteobacteria bacterium]